MTHGRTSRIRTDSRRKKAVDPLTGVSEKRENSLKSRVARLEARIEQLQEQVDLASGVLPAYFREATVTSKKRPGPDEKIDPSELLIRRDAIVKWLEEHWPDIVNPVLAARNPRQVGAVLRQVAKPRNIRPEWQHRLVSHPARLLEFLRSKKFRKKPPKKTVLDALQLLASDERSRAANRLPTRQIANAMAGVPKLKWRTSLDRCSKHPSSIRVGYNTEKHYRKDVRHPRVQAQIKPDLSLSRGNQSAFPKGHE
jgi:hypothetical protein